MLNKVLKGFLIFLEIIWINWPLIPQWLKADFFNFLIHELTSKGLVLIISKTGISSIFSSSGASSSNEESEDLFVKKVLKIVTFSSSLLTTLSFSTKGGIEECLFFLVSLSKISNFFFAVSSGFLSVAFIVLK